MNQIKEQLLDIIKSFINEDELTELDSDNQINRALHVIMSHSTQAISFVSVVEDEFEIEIEDDEIDLNTFLDINNVTSLVELHLSDLN